MNMKDALELAEQEIHAHKDRLNDSAIGLGLNNKCMHYYKCLEMGSAYCPCTYFRIPGAWIANGI